MSSISYSDYPAWNIEHARAMTEDGDILGLVPVSPRHALEAYALTCYRQMREQMANGDQELDLKKNAADILGDYVSRAPSPAASVPPDTHRADTAWTNHDDEGLRQLVIACMAIEAIAILLFRRPDEILDRLAELELASVGA